MTAQTPEKLLYQGVEHSLYSDPLQHLIPSKAVSFTIPNTTLGRGYIGTWAVEADRLYLKSLQGQIVGPEGPVPVTLSDLFPDYPDGVFAHWFSGELRCPHGVLLNYVHQGFASVYEFDFFIKVRRGVVVGERRVHNGKTGETLDDPIDLNSDDWKHLSKWTD